MSSSKAALKALRTSLDAGDFTKAVEQADDLVKYDSKNYNAWLSLGFAREKLSQYDAAEKALVAASKLRPDDPQTAKGLITLYEKQASNKLDQYHETVHVLAAHYAALDDRAQCQNVIDKYELFAKKHGSQAQYRHALGLMLPTCDLYSTLEGRVPHPSHIYGRFLESAEKEEKQWINEQIGERRTRLGARLDQVTQQVKFEAIDKFQVEDKVRVLIDWTQDDQVREELENKLMERVFDNLMVMPAEAKPEQRDKVLNQANGMVIIKRQFPLAWRIAFEWVDAEDLLEFDPNLFRQYIGYFPDDGLGKVLKGFLDSDISPYPHVDQEEENQEEDVKLSEADLLIAMQEGLEDCAESALAHRLVAYTYLALEEYESAANLARKSQQLYKKTESQYALQLTNSIDGVDLILGNSLIHHQSPRHHPEAQVLFKNILHRKPNLTAALLGVGLILEEDEDYFAAVDFLKQASAKDQSNTRIRLELAWCRALSDDLTGGLADLEQVLSTIQSEKSPNLAMKAVTLYRIAYCEWLIHPKASARKDKSGPYRYLIDAIKADSSYAPAYTLLGVYFQDYGKSKQRARVALQKAFELSTSELLAAERLAKIFADNGEWDLVELVAQRVVSSGKARPAPGSKKKASSWPYAALGVVQVNKQQYSQAIISFQAALRISPDDYHSWVGLGESYHNAGRYVAASRAFMKAEAIDHGLPTDQTWFAKYMLANVQREMCSYDEALAAYVAVLNIKEGEFGVQIALLQTLSESAWAKVRLGMFGEAANLAVRAINMGKVIAEERTDVFNLWKSIGDACSVLGQARAYAEVVDLKTLSSLLEHEAGEDAFAAILEHDNITLQAITKSPSPGSITTADICLYAAVLANKRAIVAAGEDLHAQATSWYNLGWAEYQVYTSILTGTTSKKSKKPLKAAMRCFKKAIELEAGNPEFWNALGVVTMTLSPKLSQHSFVRSLHLNENSTRTWTNIGALYLLNGDNELANNAFTRAQSADPEYANAWLGQGMLALLFGNAREARALFMHGFEIADSSSIPAKRYHAATAFDYLAQDTPRSKEFTNLLQPLLALRQLRSQLPADIISSHLRALMTERVGEFSESAMALNEVCDSAEDAYEKLESNELLMRFAQAKADSARALLGLENYDAAIEDAQTALDLTSEDELGPAYAEGRQRLRLSAHITAGLAHSHVKAIDQSLRAFQAALAEAKNEPDIVCMLAQVLWAKGSQDEKDAARTQLFDWVENHPDHVQPIMLLAVIGLLDGDEDVLEAVQDDLKSLRNSGRVSVSDKIKITKVLSGVLSSRIDRDAKAESLPVGDALMSVMLEPAQPQGWLELARVTGDEYAAEMAVANASKQVPPRGMLQAEDLADAYSNTGKNEDAVLAKVLAPWQH